MLTEKELIDAQLREWPDSRIVPASEVLTKWINDVPASKIKPWRELRAHYVTDYAYEQARMLYRTSQVAEFRLSCARWIALCVQQPVIFYECGLREDGTYKWRGARYGVEGREYMSGFPTNVI